MALCARSWCPAKRTCTDGLLTPFRGGIKCPEGGQAGSTPDQEIFMSEDIVIVGAARTPVGAFNGAFANLPAHELGKAAIQEAMKRAGVEGKQVSEVIMGQILTAGQGQNPARQASIAAGIPVESPAWGVNQLCGSGLRAVALGYQAILNGDSEI